MSVIPDSTTISFARGVPSPDVLPVAELADCARVAIEREGRTILNYGPSAGYWPLRAWVAEQHGVDASRVVLTPGSLQGFNFVTRLLFQEGGRAIVEAPSYDRTLGVLDGIGAEIESVPLTDEGLDLDRLETLVGKGPAPRLVYTIPTFQNPCGRTLSLTQREHLVELARASGVVIYEDDPYRLVRYEGEPLPSMHELARGEGVIFSSSFSKTGAPGLRVGYLLLPDELVKPVETLAASTYVSPPLVPQAMLYEYIARGRFEPNLEHVCRELGARRDAMLEALEREFPEGASWSRPEGGYFLWLDLPSGVDAAELLARSIAAGVTFVKGADFFFGPGGESALRLAFSYASIEEIHEGISRLAALVRESLA